MCGEWELERVRLGQSKRERERKGKMQIHSMPLLHCPFGPNSTLYDQFVIAYNLLECSI